MHLKSLSINQETIIINFNILRFFVCVKSNRLQEIKLDNYLDIKTEGVSLPI